MKGEIGLFPHLFRLTRILTPINQPPLFILVCLEKKENERLREEKVHRNPYATSRDKEEATQSRRQTERVAQYADNIARGTQAATQTAIGYGLSQAMGNYMDPDQANEALDAGIKMASAAIGAVPPSRTFSERLGDRVSDLFVPTKRYSQHPSPSSVASRVASGSRYPQNESFFDNRGDRFYMSATPEQQAGHQQRIDAAKQQVRERQTAVRQAEQKEKQARTRAFDDHVAHVEYGDWSGKSFKVWEESERAALAAGKVLQTEKQQLEEAENYRLARQRSLEERLRRA